MIFHVIQQNEKLEDILNIYDITLSELEEYNQHISNIKQIIPGMKLRIPNNSIDSINEIEEVTPFIEDYYPTYDDSIIKKVDDNILVEKEKSNVDIKKAIAINNKKSNHLETNIDTLGEKYNNQYQQTNLNQGHYGYYTYYGLPAYSFMTDNLGQTQSYNNYYPMSRERNQAVDTREMLPGCTDKLTKMSFGEYVLEIAPDVYYEYFIKSNK